MVWIVPSLFALETVKIGVLAKRGDAITLSRWSQTAQYLTHEIEGYRFEIVPLSFEKLRESVGANEVDFVLTNTMYYVELEYLYGVSRIATLKNLSFDGRVLTNFGGVIFTQEKSNIETLSDLKGKRFGAVNIDSFGGWVMAQKELKDHGITSSDFKEFRFFGSHDEVVRAVKNGVVDAGTVRTDTLERMAHEGAIDFKSCKIIAPKKYKDFPFNVSTALYPEWPFAKLALTPSKLANKVTIALLKMSPESKAAEMSQTAGWTIPLDYSKVHALLEDLRIGPYAKRGSLTLARFFELYEGWFELVVIGFVLIISVLLYVFRLNAKLHNSQDEIATLNMNLEQKVYDRTLELEKLYSDEKYLKDILKTVADINELLISSFSMHTIVENSMQRLSHHGQYRFVWMGIIKENLLNVLYQSNEDDIILDQGSYNLAEYESNLAFKSVKSAIDLNTTIIEKLPQPYMLNLGKNTYRCKSAWMICLPLRISEQDPAIGSLSVFSDRENGFEHEEVKMLENLAHDIGLAIQSISQRSKLKIMELEKVSNYEETILAFVNIIEQRDSYTAGHTLRVAEYCRIIATEMGIEEKEIAKLERAAILHDIGKVVTPDAILLKPGKLTALEYELIKQHSFAGYRMLSKIDMYKDLAEIIKYHHARYDGNGYPSTTPYDPDAINILSHIMIVADAFDAMTSNRIYKIQKSREEAIEEIKAMSGSQFHPNVAAAAINALKDVQIIDTHQTPDNQFEQRRFAYFFLDALTDLYNENYLKTVIIQHEDERRCLQLLSLENFSSYNKKHGWAGGDLFLKNFAVILQEHYNNAMIFRYHGDQFILLFETHQEISKQEILDFDLFKNSGVNLLITHYDLQNGIPRL
jgi:two-component system, LuxR family, sensor histidine kinase TtrS